MPEFELRTDHSGRHRVMENAIRYIRSQTDQDVIIAVDPLEETRREIQRDLDWLWNGQIAKQMHTNPNWVHGETKLTLLLPMMLTSNSKKMRKRGQLLKEIIDYIPVYSRKVAVAKDMIRSKDVSVKFFAEYLSAKQLHYAEQGIVLESNKEREAKALGERFGE